MIKTSLVYILIFSLFISCKSVNYEIDETRFKESLFQQYKNAPGVSYIVIENSNIIEANSYGFANLEDSIKSTNQTNYRIASVSKQFTAFAILQLIEKGQLSYQTNLKEVFPEFPKYGSEITIIHLLTHRSGLINYSNFLEEGQTKQMLDKDVLKGLYKTDSTYFKPGSKYKYSNTGYAVLAQIIEKTSRLSFADYMKSNIFLPLKMNNSLIYEENKNIKNRALGYIVKDSSVTLKDQSLTSAIQGDGGIYSSILDYYKWDKALYDTNIIDVELLEDAYTAWKENGKTKENGYGFGWSIKYVDSLKLLEHGGSSSGFGSHVIRVPEKELTVAIFTNRNKTGYELKDKATALLSLQTNYQIKMPINLIIENETKLNGVKSSLKLFDALKTNIRYQTYTSTLFYLGIDCLNSKQLEIAKSYFNKSVKEYPNFYGGYYGLAVYFEKKGNNNKALKYYKLASDNVTTNEGWVKSIYEKKLILTKASKI